MTLRKGHGAGAGEPRVEVLPANELPAPVPALPTLPPGKLTRQELSRRGGLAKAAASKARRAAAEAEAAERAERTRLMSSLGLVELAADAAFASYRSAGDAFVGAHLAALAAQAGGSVGPGPASIVASAGVQLAASRFFSDKAATTGEASLFSLASSLANASRQNLLAAYELAVREAEARKKLPGGSALAKMRATAAAREGSG